VANQVIANRRLNNLRIAGRTLDQPEAVVKELGALQAQDYMQAVWAIGLRTASAVLTEVEQAIADRKIILSWMQRGTIHALPPEDVKWMLRLAAPRVLRQGKTRLAQLGLDEDTLSRCRNVIHNALKSGGVISRPALLQLLEEAGISTAGQRGYHILWTSAYQGLICFGPRQGKQQTFVLLDEWVTDSRELSFEESRAELARRYFASHGPATVQDFAWWTGMTLTDAGKGLEAVKSSFASEIIEGKEYWMPQAPAADTDRNSGVHLLAGFDEFILGYKDRSAVLEPENAHLIVPGNNGIFLPTLVADGKVLGTWKRSFKKQGIELTVHPFEPVGEREGEVLQAAERYAAFIGLPLIQMDFI